MDFHPLTFVSESKASLHVFLSLNCFEKELYSFYRQQSTNIYLFGRGKECKNGKGDICAMSLLCFRYDAFGLQGFLFLIFYSARR
jgi:hypothetical protein